MGFKDLGHSVFAPQGRPTAPIETLARIYAFHRFSQIFMDFMIFMDSDDLRARVPSTCRPTCCFYRNLCSNPCFPLISKDFHWNPQTPYFYDFWTFECVLSSPNHFFFWWPQDTSISSRKSQIIFDTIICCKYENAENSCFDPFRKDGHRSIMKIRLITFEHLEYGTNIFQKAWNVFW